MVHKGFDIVFRIQYFIVKEEILTADCSPLCGIMYA